MSLSRKIADALDAYPGNDPAQTGLTVEDGLARLSLSVTANGPVGLAFDTLDFATGARESWSEADLKAWGGRIAARVTYLMEPLVLLEHDTTGGALELRSHAPTARADERAYYEVRLGDRGTLHLSRVAFDESSRRRRAVPCQMTREVLERLADDLVASVP